MMLITELMQGGDLGTRLRNDMEVPRRTGWYRQGCYYALGIARSGGDPFQTCVGACRTACCLSSIGLPERNDSAFLP